MLIDDYLFEPCGYLMNGINNSVSYDAKNKYNLIYLNVEHNLNYQ